MDPVKIKSAYEFYNALNGGQGIQPSNIVEALTKAGARNIQHYKFES